MSEGPTFACDSCGKTYAWKEQIAGKKAKCKCGATLTVPTEAPEPPDSGLDDLYALVPDGPVDEGASARIAMPTPAPVPSSAPRIPGAAALPYQRGPTAREQEFAKNANFIDQNRDIYVPVALLIIGLASYVSHYAIRYQMSGSGIGIVTLGICLMTAFKAALMIGFAMVIAGPLGVSFGGVGTAALKLAAIAVFSDGVGTWIDDLTTKMAGTSGFSGMLSFPIIIGIYWTMLIYLFSMDPGDSWLVVILLAFFDMLVRWIILFLLLAVVMNMSGIASSAISSAAGAAGSAASSAMSATVEHFNELKEAKLLKEAGQYIADGHQASLKPSVDAWYAAGAKKVYFHVDRDINGHEDPGGIVIELPTDKAARVKIFDAIKKYETDLNLGDGEKDDGEPYIFIDILS
jgi:hypothetical protein